MHITNTTLFLVALIGVGVIALFLLVPGLRSLVTLSKAQKFEQELAGGRREDHHGGVALTLFLLGLGGGVALECLYAINHLYSELTQALVAIPVALGIVAAITVFLIGVITKERPVGIAMFFALGMMLVMFILTGYGMRQ